MGISIYQARFPSELYDTLKERAYRERRSVNSMVVQAVEELLLKQERESKK